MEIKRGSPIHEHDEQGRCLVIYQYIILFFQINVKYQIPYTGLTNI